jgi:hypothetical protein
LFEENKTILQLIFVFLINVYLVSFLYNLEHLKNRIFIFKKLSKFILKRTKNAVKKSNTRNILEKVPPNNHKNSILIEI